MPAASPPPDAEPEIYAAERFSEAEHLRDRPFVVPTDFRLDDALFSLHAETSRGRTRAHYEVDSIRTETLETTLKGLVKAIGRLSPRGKAAWKKLRTRDFNIGIQAGREPHLVEYEATARTIAAVAALGGRLVITVYAPFPRPDAK